MTISVFSNETKALIYGLVIGVAIFIAGFIMCYITRPVPGVFA